MMNNEFDYHRTMSQRDHKDNDIMLSMQQDTWMQNYDKNTDELVTNPAACDLKDIVLYYQSQPELLRLILMSKVEEDKRRAEEAKLKAKELDLLLHHQQDFASQNNNAFIHNQNFLGQPQFYDRRPSVIDMLMEENDCGRRDSALGSSFDGSFNSNDELDERTFSPTVSMLSMSFPPQTMVSNQHCTLSPPFSFGQDQQITTQIKPEQHRSSSISSGCLPSKPRKRREMQAISKIVETREHPYNDGFFWKNNGNTIQKKTGNKSIYYKCSNSAKGCPVNKTVTAKENEEYLIKYRGYHLPDCGNIQRIVDV
ncbi:hypothetical protein G6F56_008029 [Rhizopus delemar]|nr:hypothetical protein G6F56_008029 [Rhizopus delemar]